MRVASSRGVLLIQRPIASLKARARGQPSVLTQEERRRLWVAFGCVYAICEPFTFWKSKALGTSRSNRRQRPRAARSQTEPRPRPCWANREIGAWLIWVMANRSRSEMADKNRNGFVPRSGSPIRQADNSGTHVGFVVNPKAYREFLARLDAPPRPNERLLKSTRMPAPWD